MPTSNCPSSTLLERIKQLFGKKPGSAPEESSMDIETAVRKPSSSYTKLQGMAKDSGDHMPVINPGADEAYQASRSGAAATTSAAAKTNTTINKLQALSASGTGTGPTTEQLALGSLLDDLQNPKPHSSEAPPEDQETA